MIREGQYKRNLQKVWRGGNEREGGAEGQCDVKEEEEGQRSGGGVKVERQYGQYFRSCKKSGDIPEWGQGKRGRERKGGWKVRTQRRVERYGGSGVMKMQRANVDQ